jgi:beta-phosphoglucomutase-like phosphatase (HAD superfamily)
MIEAILFDMDGVIIDSEPLHKETFFLMADKLGFSMNDKAYDAFIGRSAVSQWQYAVDTFDLDKPAKVLAQEQIAMFMEQLDIPGKATPSPGLDVILKFIEKRCLLSGLASSNDRPVVEKIVRLLGLEKYLKAVVSADDAASAKPAPDVFLLAAQKIGVSPDRCLVVEDASNGIRAAKAAGMSCIAYKNPNSGEQNLSEADYQVDRLDEVVAIIEQRSF